MFTNKKRPCAWYRPADQNPALCSSSHQGLLAANPKRRLMQLQQSDRIYRDNMHLLRKLRDVDYKSSKQRAQTFHLKSLNSKNRSDSDYRIYNENLQLIGRLQSQKSRYNSSDIMRRSYQRKRASTSKSKTESSQTDFLPPQYEKIPTATDGFENRLLIYTELVTLNKQLHHVEVSQNGTMYYVLLHNLTFDRLYKLRLVEATGEHLVSLIEGNRMRFADRIHKRNGTYILSIPFYPFIRNYTFWVLQKAAINTSQQIDTTFSREHHRSDDQGRLYTQPTDDDQVLRRELQNDQKQHNQISKENMYQTSTEHKHSRKSSSKVDPSEQRTEERLDPEPTPTESLSSKRYYEECFDEDK